MKSINALGLKTFALKPIASGCQRNRDGKLRNQDALYLHCYASIKKSYEVVNPIAFEKPIAPHIAANEMNTRLSKKMICESIMESIQNDADINLIEGVGGWDVPLNDSELFSDVIIELNIPIILIVGIKLGCLNHALLTSRAILAREGRLFGWIANCLDPNTLSIEENIDTLRHWIRAPCLGVVPHHDKFGNAMSSHLDIELIQGQLFQQSGIARRQR